MEIVIPTERLKTENGHVKQRSVFLNKQPDHRELASEIIRSDCINKGYRVFKSLGSGAYAKVKLAEVSVSKLARHVSMADHLETGNLQVAIKIIQKKIVPQEFLKKFLPRELDNHIVLPPHPHVVRCFEQFSTCDFTYLVMEYVSNGDLLDMINHSISKIERGLGEEISKKFFKQIVLGLNHIHQHGIVHRDLKCENILIDGNLDAKITDFGFSCRYNDKATLLKTSCGSYAYTAPEVIKNQPYDGTRADIWSLGIILCAMVNGRLPYNDGHLSDMDEDMRMQRLRFERHVPFDCMVLARKLLQYNPTMRPTIDEILNDPWLTGKKPIPRQTLKPKWLNSYSVNKADEAGKENAKLRVDGSKPNTTSPICYRATYSENGKSNGAEAVVLNSAARETIILKSRRQGNAYRSVPLRNERRPQTWPKAVREQAEKIRPDMRSVSEDKHNNERIQQLMNGTKERARATLVKKVNNNGASKPSEYTPLAYMYKYLQPDGKIQCRSPSPPMSQKHKTRLVTTHTLPPTKTPPPTQFNSVKVRKAIQQRPNSTATTVDNYCRQQLTMLKKRRATSAKPAEHESADTPDLDMLEVDMVLVKGKVSPESRIKSVPASGNRRKGLSQIQERQSPAERAKSCRERIMHTYSNKTISKSAQKSSLPTLVIQRLAKKEGGEEGLSFQAPYGIQDRSRSTSAEKHSIKTVYKYKYH